jgi:hypothetical protein
MRQYDVSLLLIFIGADRLSSRLIIFLSKSEMTDDFRSYVCL